MRPKLKMRAYKSKAKGSPHTLDISVLSVVASVSYPPAWIRTVENHFRQRIADASTSFAKPLVAAEKPSGGTIKDGRIEIQGDKREEVAKILVAAGFRPVFAGG
jgi:hypothetical protein